jgi:chemotaxis protein histidine kinase CheA
VVKRSVSSLGGQIRIASAPSKYAQFRLVLPSFTEH